MKRRSRERLLLIGCGLILAGLMFTVTQVVFPRRQPGAVLPTDTPCRPATNDLMILLVPLLGHYRQACEQSYWMPNATDEFHVLVRFNNFGLHARDYALEKPPGIFRVLIVGDSFPQAMQVSYEQAFPQLLQARLDRPVEVINLSVEAYGTDRELLLYAALGWRFQPDLVLLSIYAGNDIQDNAIDLETRRFGYRIKRAFFTLTNETSASVGTRHASSLHLHNSPTFEPALYPDSPAYTWLTAVQAAQLPPPPDNPPEHPTILSREPYALEYPVELGLYLPEDDHWQTAWALTGALIRQFRDLVEAQGATFAAFIIPDRRAVHQADWQKTLVDYAGALPMLRDSDPGAPSDRLSQMLAASDIPYLDLTPALREWAAAHTEGRLYYAGDGHFDPQGHALAGALLDRWLRESGLVIRV